MASGDAGHERGLWGPKGETWGKGHVSVRARSWLGSKLGGRVMVMVRVGAGERSELGSWSELGLVNKRVRVG